MNEYTGKDKQLSGIDMSDLHVAAPTTVHLLHY